MLVGREAKNRRAQKAAGRVFPNETWLFPPRRVASHGTGHETPGFSCHPHSYPRGRTLQRKMRGSSGMLCGVQQRIFLSYCHLYEVADLEATKASALRYEETPEQDTDFRGSTGQQRTFHQRITTQRDLRPPRLTLPQDRELRLGVGHLPRVAQLARRRAGLTPAPAPSAFPHAASAQVRDFAPVSSFGLPLRRAVRSWVTLTCKARGRANAKDQLLSLPTFG